MTDHLKYIILLVIGLSCATIRSAAGSFVFRHIGRSQGLPHQQVEALAQDRFGRIWIGTRNGLVWYDGNAINPYYHDSSKGSIAHNFVHGLLADHHGRVWVITEGGLSRYRYLTDDFVNYRHSIGDCWTIAETRHGKVYVGGKGLWRYDAAHDRFQSVLIANFSMVYSLAVDRKDNLYAYTDRGVFCFNASFTQVHAVAPQLIPSYPNGDHGLMPLFIDSSDRLWAGLNGYGLVGINLRTGRKVAGYDNKQVKGAVRTIAEDGSHRLWVGTENGIYIIGATGIQYHLQYEFYDNNGLSDNAIYAILCDTQKNIWIGSYFGGVDVLPARNSLFTLYNPGIKPNEIHARVPRGIIELPTGECWIATEDGGINILKDGVFTKFNGISGLDVNVHSLYYDAQRHSVWIGTRFQGLFCYDLYKHQAKHYQLSKAVHGEAVFALCRQPNGKLWVATMQGLYYYDAAHDRFLPIHHPQLSNTYIYSLTTDHDGNLWVGTVAYGAFRISLKSGRIDQLVPKEEGLRDKYIICLFTDSKGMLWVGTNNNGLQCIDPHTMKVVRLKIDEVLKRCTVSSIAEDRKGALWIATSIGLWQYNLSNHVLTPYTSEDGLPVSQFNYNSAFRLSTGELLMGTTNGLVRFNPLTVQRHHQPLIVHLVRLLLNSQPIVAGEESPLKHNIDCTQKLVLSHREAQSVCIEYGVVRPLNATSVEYQVMLDGVDKSWRDVGADRKFYINNLSPGTYKLHIRANDSNGQWDGCPTKTLEIVVKPPLLLSPWALVFYLVLVVIGIRLAFRTFNARMSEKNAMRMAVLEKKKLEEVDRTKSEFFTNVSHELKTPLSLIVAPLKCISRQTIDEETRKHLDTALLNTRKLETLINELVTFNKVQSDNFPFYVQRDNPLDFVERIVALFRHAATAHNITLAGHYENNGEYVWFSPSYVEHILDNLLSNALKFTPSGGRVTVRAAIVKQVKKESELNGTYLSLVVSDTGIGIAKEEQAHIFDRFYRTSRGSNADHSGWGIGLALVKRLVQIHHGSVSVESTPGKGTTFTVLLNVEKQAFLSDQLVTDDKVVSQLSDYQFSHTADMFRPVEDKETDDHEDSRHTLLLVDDNDDLLEFLGNFLSGQYHVLKAKNGEEALRMAHEEDVEIIVSDIMMPGMDGVTLCHTIKADVATSHIPVILLTAKSEPGDVIKGYEQGADAYVTKPFDPQILELQVNNILQLVKNRQIDIMTDGDTSAGESSLNELDKKFLNEVNKLIEDHIEDSEFGVNDVTEALHISRTTLHLKMKNLVNISMGGYIRHKRLVKACELLKQGYNVSETAYGAGFADPNYFSKVFRKAFGVSPTQYTNNEKKHNNNS